MYIRADGNEIIATGHIMRCLSIAEALRELGEESTFILADDRSRDLIEAKGFSVIVLHSVWNDLNQETDKMIQYIKDYHIEKLLIDSYFVTFDYLNALREYTELNYIDDLNAFPYPVDRLINYGFMADRIPYADTYKKDDRQPEFCIGCDYVPLRREFQNVSYKVRKGVKDVLITTGGTDGFNVAGNILKQTMEQSEFQDISFHVVAGRFNKNLQMLHEMALHYENVTIYENISNMSELMQSCDVAVTAGGSTTYELCAVGIPSVCLSIADNQKEGVKNWEKEGIMLYAGDMESEPEQCIQNILEHLSTYMDDDSMRIEKSKNMRSLVDGQGAMRLAKLLQMEAIQC